MKCLTCGAEIPDEYKFCGNCGHEIAVQESKQETRYRFVLSLIGTVVAVFVAVVAIVVGTYLVIEGIVLLRDAQQLSEPYFGLRTSYWDMDHLQQAIAMVVFGSLLIIGAANYLIVKVVVSNAIRRLKRQISPKL